MGERKVQHGDEVEGERQKRKDRLTGARDEEGRLKEKSAQPAGS